MHKIKIRPVQNSDVDLLYNWVNESTVRQNSFCSEPISYSDHMRWFNQCLIDKTIEIYICEVDGLPIGQIRICYQEDKVILDYSVDHRYRGKGMGSEMISRIEMIIRNTHPDIHWLIGKVKSINLASRRVFEKNSFSLISTTNDIYVYQKNLIDNYDSHTC